ncbi:DNA starvation/stationary phase protection protein [Paenibacillus sp. TRM 82003]|nr:DNA starvation/stationary phase protection protein [Paenibacillus sp. TRM 82003]
MTEKTLLLDRLNRQVANWAVLHMKLHHYHWNVTGGLFFTLHEQFETWYGEAAATMDELAERILALGGKPLSRLQDHLGASSIREAQGGESAERMLRLLAEDYTTIAKETRDAAAVAEEHGDSITADLMIGLAGKLEKRIWMLRAANQQRDVALTY